MIGEKLANRYEIVAELGRGGMGVVYRALDPLLDREVAVKLVTPALLTRETEQRFQSEAQIVAQMDHPSIVPIYDLGNHEGSLFFVMPVLEGTSLHDLIRTQALNLGEILDVIIEVADALSYSHMRGVIHRDIKPENVMVVREEGVIRVRVMDFGLARRSAVTGLTKTGVLVGTVSYVSPELVTGGSVDERSDVYSLGTVLYNCIANDVPFGGELQSVLYRIVHENPRPPRSLGAPIDEELERIILRCLAKEPERRPGSAAELMQVLRDYRSKLQENQRGKSVTLDRPKESRHAASAFVGRQDELRQLQDRLNTAIAGECQFVALSGEPGVGKTRLLEELERLARARRIRVLHGRIVEQDAAFPYHGFCEAIQEYFRRTDSESLEEDIPDLTDLAADLVALFPMLSEIEPIRSGSGERKPTTPAAESRSPESRTRIFELLARTLTRLAGGKPLILILEEFHGADVSAEALQYVVRRLGPTPTLIVITCRSSEFERGHPVARMLENFRGDRRFATIALKSFTREVHQEYLTTLVGDGRLGVSLADRLFEASEGNPFFAKELVRSLLATGEMTRNVRGTWTLSGGSELSADSLPATIQQAVEKRIGRLPDELRSHLSIAAVMGKSFAYRDLESLTGDPDGLDDGVDQLVQEGLIEEERRSRGDRLTFTSGVVRDVLYAELSRRKRRSLHRKFARILERRYAGRQERIYPQLLHHYSEGDVPESTVEYGLAQAKKSLRAFAADEAIRAAKIALEFLDDEWEGDSAIEGEARMLLAAGHQMDSELEESLREIDASIRIFSREEQKRALASALLFASKAAWQARKIEDATSYVDRGVEAAREAGASVHLRQFLSLAATLAGLRGEFDLATRCRAEAEELRPKQHEPESERDLPRGGVLVAAISNSITAREPAESQLIEEHEIFANAFETLLTMDEEGNLISGLAEKWEGRERGRSFRFSLREGVRFQDGSPLTAESVKRSFERSIREASPNAPPAFPAIRGFQELDDGATADLHGMVVHSERELEIFLSDPLPNYPVLLTDVRAAITRRSEEQGSPLVGSGPFRICERDKERMRLESDTSYWQGEPPRVDALEFRLGLSAAAIAAGLRSGRLDLGRDLKPRDLEEILNDPGYRGRLVEVPQKTTYFVLFNTRTGPAGGNEAMRQALSGILRARDLVWRTLGRFAQPASGIYPPGILGHDPGRRPRVMSRDEARERMAASGLRTPIQLQASVHPLFHDRYRTLLAAILAEWAELDVQVSVATEDMESFLASWEDNDSIDVLIGRWAPDYNDPDNVTHTLFHSENGLFRKYFSSPEADELLEHARSEIVPSVRESLYRKFERLVLDLGVMVPLLQDVDYRVAGAAVHGIHLGSVPPHVNYASLGKATSEAPMPRVRPGLSGVLRVPMTGAIRGLDPTLNLTTEQDEVMPSIYETLTRDLGEARIGPWLAEEFHTEEGGQRYHFRLRKGVVFHDGRRLTARDVRYSFERLLRNRESRSRSLYSVIRGARAVLDGERRDLTGFNIRSASEFTIELEKPVSFFPGLLAFSAASVLPEGSNPDGSSWRDGIVGTGPFRVSRFLGGRRLEVERNPSYWREGFPRSRGLSFVFGIAPREILTGFRGGEYSLASELYPEDVDDLRREPEFAARYQESPRLATYYAVFNVHRGPLSDRTLRQKLVQSIDVQRLVLRSLGRVAIPAQGLIPPGLLGFEPFNRVTGGAGALAPSSVDLELTVAVHPVFHREYSAFYDALSNAARSVGIRFRPIEDGLGDLIEARRQSKVDLALVEWVAAYPDPDSFAQILQSREGFIGPLCGSLELDRLIERGRAETRPETRHMIYRQVEDLTQREARLLPLFHEQVYCFARPEVDGLTVSYGNPAVAYESLKIIPPR